jgi:ribosomal protein S18 acetylase RimI-like enzyme
VPVREAAAEDVDAVFALLERRNLAVFGESELEPRWIEHTLAQSGCDCFVAEDAGRVVGWASLDSDHDFTLAASSDDGAGALFARVEELAAERGFDSLTNIVVREDSRQWSLLERSGFAVDREILRMWRTLDGDVPAAEWPSGISVRAYEDADGERVHALLDDVYAGWDRDYVERRHDDWLAFMTAHDDFDPSLWFLVERDDELVGCALHWREAQGKGWVKDLVVDPSERGRGLGKALLQHGFAAYRDRGAERVGLKVDAGNPTGAPQLYERVGFVIDRRYAVWTKRL